MQISRFVNQVHSVLELVTSVVLASIMLLVVLDTVLRYVWNLPLGFVYEVSTLYLMVALFFLALSASYSNGFHIRVHVILDMFGPRAKLLAFVVTEACAIVFFAIVTMEVSKELWTAIRLNEAVVGIISWPTWPKYTLVFLGCLLMTVNLILIWMGHVVALVTGKSVEPEKVSR